MIDPGYTPVEAALIEAWEEAGLTGIIEADPVGSYLYSKGDQDYFVTTYLLRVTEFANDWPEQKARRREIITPEEAVNRLREPGLQKLIAKACNLKFIANANG